MAKLFWIFLTATLGWYVFSPDPDAALWGMIGGAFFGLITSPLGLMRLSAGLACALIAIWIAARVFGVTGEAYYVAWMLGGFLVGLRLPLGVESGRVILGQMQAASMALLRMLRRS